ncbi:MAG: Mfa1 family fimbria major subunit [Tannerellaceae bacterium]|jgi:hypothetical protein|nr:Mfa1 family fimbria major subunit [Tannerellaceae bacterium]
MKQVIKFFVVAAAVAAGFTSCSSEEVIPNTPTTLERASLTIVLNNRDAATKADGDGNAVAAETAIKSVSIFVFGAKPEAEKDTFFTIASSSSWSGQDGQYEATVKDLPVGSKQIYVGLNLPSALHADIKANGISAAQTWAEADLGNLSSATDGFPMFSDGTKPVGITLVKGNNEIEVSVKRLVAKVTVQNEKDFEDNLNGERTANGMTIDANIQFALGQMNTKAYLFPRASNVDPNYDGTNYLADFVNEHYDFKTNKDTWTESTSDVFKNFKAVTTSGDATDITKHIPAYALENTHALKRKGEMTYVAIKAKFTPQFIHSYTKPNLTATANTANNLPKLYVFNDGGSFLYFTNKAEADSYASDTNLGYETYNDCYSFYTVYLNPSDYNVLRNDYYAVAVEKIAKIGKPYPGATDPEEEMDAVAEIIVKITVQNWHKVSQSTILGEKE